MSNKMKCRCKDSFCDTCNPVARISERQAEILSVIESATVPGVRYWLPTGREEYPPRLRHKEVIISGSGDASSLRALVKRGFIVKPNGSTHRYAYAITGQGVRSLDHHFKPDN